MKVWIFQCSPKRWRVFEAFKDPEFQQEGTWEINQYKTEIKKGDLALTWVAGQSAGIYQVCDIVSDPAIMGDVPSGKYWINASDSDRNSLRVLVTVKWKLYDYPVLRSELMEIPELKNLKILRFFQATNFPVSAGEWEIIERLIKQRVEETKVL